MRALTSTEMIMHRTKKKQGAVLKTAGTYSRAARQVAGGSPNNRRFGIGVAFVDQEIVARMFVNSRSTDQVFS